MKLRRATPAEDWAAIHAFVTDAFAGMEGRIDPQSSIHRWTAETFAAEAASGAAWLAKDDGALIGCGFAKVAGDALYLGKIAAHADHRGKGVACAIIAAAEGEAKLRGLAALEIQTRIELTENHAAFAALIECPYS